MPTAAPVTLTSLRSESPRLTVPRAGAYFGLSRPHAYELAARGEFPVAVHTVGSRYYVLLTELAAALGVEPRLLLSDD